MNFERVGSAGGAELRLACEGRSEPSATFAQEPGDLPPNDPSFVDPVLRLRPHRRTMAVGDSQSFTGRSVTGGYIYRGPIAELQGKYILWRLVEPASLGRDDRPRCEWRSRRDRAR